MAVKKKCERLYKVWANMKQRCFNPKNPDFSYYGGRGIKMCDEWRSDYTAFRDWAIANGYDENAKFGDCTIDRIDVNGNYEPDNCRWVTMKEQNWNRRGCSMLDRKKEKAEAMKRQVASVFNIALRLTMEMEALLKERELTGEEESMCECDFKIIDFLGRKVLVAAID